MARESAAVDARARFAADQVAMTATWYANLLKSGRDVDAHIASRKAAYLARWREAGRYFGPGRRVLDIGGGNLFDDLFVYFGEMGWDYWYFDVGEVEAAASAEIGGRFGVPANRFACGLNHELAYEDDSFDAIFSSHCVEHSMDLALTLRQLNRILKPGGDAVISVPFGWDAQPNHPYFFNETEWLILLEDAGFRIRAYQIGDEYPEIGQDLMIAARKAQPPADRSRIAIANYVKTNYRFRDFRDPSIAYEGAHDVQDNYVILDGADWRIGFSLAQGETEVCPLFSRHAWSGVVTMRSGGDHTREDLFRPRAAVAPMRLTLTKPAAAGQPVEIFPLGKRDASQASQGVFLGVMTR